jgi:hypothetical protein
MADPVKSSGKSEVADRRTDPAMQKLFQMSRTAGVGLADYKAVNVFSVIALLVGIASLIIVLPFIQSTAVLAVPMLALLLGVVGFIQVRRSNGTQTGILLAAAGILLGGGLMATSFLYRTSIQSQNRVLMTEANTLAQSFATHVAAGEYDKAYQLLDPRLQERVKIETFQQVAKAVSESPGAYGGPVKTAVIGDMLDIQRDDGAINADGLLIFELNVKDPRTNENARAREPFALSRIGDAWKIRNIPNWFPPSSPAGGN